MSGVESYMSGIDPQSYVTVDDVTWLQTKSDTTKYSRNFHFPTSRHYHRYPRFAVTLKIINRRSIQVEGVSMPFLLIEATWRVAS
jgi:hypothetical protein